MQNRTLAIYLTILALLCGGFIAGMLSLGQQGAYLAQAYMLTPAFAALITRQFFYKQRFRDANLRLGRPGDYVKYWLYALGITALSYVLFTALGGIKWDLSGKTFLDNLAAQFAATGQDINATLPPGFTPQMMLAVFVLGGLTVFNLVPGIITGFGEEFGHRGLMFPLLYQISPWAGFIAGGLIWFAWHLPLALVVPQTTEWPLWQTVLNALILAVGSLCSFAYLAYVYVKTRSVFVTSVAHIAMNNAAAALSYFVVIQNQALANLGLTLTMVIVVLILYYRQGFQAFAAYFQPAA